MLHRNDLFLLFLFMVLIFPARSQDSSGIAVSLDSVANGKSQDEIILYNMINDMRRQNKLPLIPFSNALSHVAHVHIDDLILFRPQDKGCSLQGWSNSGKWSPCCNAKDPSGLLCMKSKPKEITGYLGNGYELIYWSEDKASPAEAAGLWQQVNASSDMLLNRGKWKSYQWKAIGVGIEAGYAILWLGDRADRSLPVNSVKPKAVVSLPADTSDIPLQLPAAELTTKKPESGVNKVAVVEKQTAVTSLPVFTTGTRYYLIVSSLKTEQAALTELNRIKSNGFGDAFILISESGYRIALTSFDTPRKAAIKASQLKDEFPGIWVFKK